MEYQFFKLEIFIPESHFGVLQQALLDVDAGHIGKYDSCLSYSRVTSTWRPLEGTCPYSGQTNVLSVEEELKVEVTCRADSLDETMWKIKEVHPYEEPVIHVIPLYDVGISQTSQSGTDSYRQYRFDDNLNIICENHCREMSDAEKEEYNKLVEGACQLNLMDFLT